MMGTTVTASANQELDQVLELLCEALQLSPTEREDADQKYTSVGNWLSADGSRLQVLQPKIRYQGSILLGTVTKPWQREEFDVDLMCILQATIHQYPNPAVVYDLVANRMAEHAVYRELMEPKDRCIQLNYSGQFHLDIVPALPQYLGSMSLFIPDRSKGAWVGTKPFEYAWWFKSRTALSAAQRELYEKKARADIAPLPPPVKAADISPLQRTVQLLKRRRDVYFRGDDDAPKSIALTTLAGNHYRGEQLCTDALIGMLGRLKGQLEATRGILVVPNPVDPTENLGRHWNMSSYRKFVRFIDTFLQEMTQLLTTRGWDAIQELLEELFGDRARVAVEKYAKRLEEKRRGGGLGFSRGPAVISALPSVASQRKVPPNEFFGS